MVGMQFRVLLLGLFALTVFCDDAAHQALKDAIKDEATTDKLRALLKKDTITKEIVNLPAPRGASFVYPGYTVIHYCCLMGKHKHLKMLLEYGGDPNKLSLTNIAPLHVASNWGQAACVKVLLKNHAKTRQFSGTSGMGAVSLAAREGHVNVLREFRRAGGEAVLELTMEDDHKQSPLSIAISNGNIDMMRFMLFEVGLGDIKREEILAAGQAVLDKGANVEGLLDYLKKMLNYETDEFRQERQAYYKEQERIKQGLPREDPDAKKKQIAVGASSDDEEL